MAKTTNSNHGGVWQWAGADSDAFDRTDVSGPAEDLDLHDHSANKGLAVARLATAVTLTAPTTFDGGTVTIHDGLTVTAGGLTVSAGDLAVSSGTITASGVVKGSGLRATADGGGLADTLTLVYAAPGLGGGAAPTLGTIGGSGPAGAPQQCWLKVYVGVTAYFIPLWA